MKRRAAYRSIVLVCPECQGVLRGTGRVIQNGHVFRCDGCDNVYRWWHAVWRRLYGFELIESRPIFPQR